MSSIPAQSQLAMRSFDRIPNRYNSWSPEISITPSNDKCKASVVADYGPLA